jgi:hypothetical protein
MPPEKKKKPDTKKKKARKAQVQHLQQSRDILREMNEETERFNKGLKDADSFTKKMTKNNAKILQALIDGRKESGISGKQIKEVADLTKKINSGEIDIVKSKRMQNNLEAKLLKAKSKGSKEAIQTQIDLLKNMDDATAAQAKMNKLKEAGGKLDDAFGGFAKKLKGFLVNPLTAALALLVAFNSTQESIAKDFGAIGVTEFRKDISSSQKQFKKLGFNADEANKTITDLANNFGLSLKEASKLSKTVAETAAATGMTLDESQKLIGVFTKTQGLSADQANELIRSTQALAKANDVAPDKVLGDVANNTEQFAAFAKDGGKNILRAAVQARKLGISLTEVAKVSDGLLNFQDSLTKEIEASTLIGRQLNLQKARELALAGDLEGVQSEILKQVGSEAEFNEMNALQRQALADAVGLQTSELQKLVSAEKEAVTLQGALSKQPIDKIVSEKAITATAGLIQNLKVMGLQLAETLGPAVNVVAKVFGGLVKVLDKLGGLLPPLIGLTTVYAGKKLLARLAVESETKAEKENLKTKVLNYLNQQKKNIVDTYATIIKGKETVATLAQNAADKSTMTQMTTLIGIIAANTAALYGNTLGKLFNAKASDKKAAAENRGMLTTIKSTGKNIVEAVSNFFGGAAKMSSATFGLGTVAAVAIAALAVGAMLGAVASATMVGDMHMAAGGGPIVTTPQGERYEGSVRDEVLMAPNIAGAGAASATAPATDTSKLENKQNETNSKLERVASVLEGALSGPKPALARAMGGAVGDTVDGMA